MRLSSTITATAESSVSSGTTQLSPPFEALPRYASCLIASSARRLLQGIVCIFERKVVRQHQLARRSRELRDDGPHLLRGNDRRISLGIHAARCTQLERERPGAELSKRRSD